MEEAVALSMGKAPEFVNWNNIQHYGTSHLLHFGMPRLWDLTKRALAWRKLSDPVSPIIFINWAKENDIELPAMLAETVIARNGGFVNWKNEYEKLKAQYDERIADWRRIVEERGELLETSTQNNEILKSKLAECQAELAAKAEDTICEKQQSPREREGMLKVIYAMTVGGYGYDRSSGRSNLVPEIVRI